MEYHKDYSKTTADTRNKKFKEFYSNNSELWKLKNKQYYENNKEKVIKRNKEYYKRRKQHNFNFKELYVVKTIDYSIAQNYVVANHYLHRKSPFKYAFGLYIKANDKLVGVCIFGKSCSASLNKMICGQNIVTKLLN
jgi:hypothetical protein